MAKREKSQADPADVAHLVSNIRIDVEYACRQLGIQRDPKRTLDALERIRENVRYLEKIVKGQDIPEPAPLHEEPR